MSEITMLKCSVRVGCKHEMFVNLCLCLIIVFTIVADAHTPISGERLYQNPVYHEQLYFVHPVSLPADETLQLQASMHYPMMPLQQHHNANYDDDIEPINEPNMIRILSQPQNQQIQTARRQTLDISEMSFSGLPHQQSNDNILPLEPLIFEAPGMPITIYFRTSSSSVKVIQEHFSSQTNDTYVERTKSQDAPQRLYHEVRRPIIQEVHEIIKPYRNIIQELRPITEQVHTIVPVGATLHNSQGHSSFVDAVDTPTGSDLLALNRHDHSHRKVRHHSHRNHHQHHSEPTVIRKRPNNKSKQNKTLSPSRNMHSNIKSTRSVQNGFDLGPEVQVTMPDIESQPARADIVNRTNIPKMEFRPTTTTTTTTVQPPTTIGTTEKFIDSKTVLSSTLAPFSTSTLIPISIPATTTTSDTATSSPNITTIARNPRRRNTNHNNEAPKPITKKMELDERRKMLKTMITKIDGEKGKIRFGFFEL